MDIKQLSRVGSLTGSYLSYISKNISSTGPRRSIPGFSSIAGWSVSASVDTNAINFPFGATLWEYEQQNRYLPRQQNKTISIVRKTIVYTWLDITCWKISRLQYTRW